MIGGFASLNPPYIENVNVILNPPHAVWKTKDLVCQPQVNIVNLGGGL